MIHAASLLANHLWQSTLFAVAAWLLVLALRKHRAAVRYGVWLAASVKFLIPFSLLIDAGSQLARGTPGVIAPTADFSRTVERLSQPFTLPVSTNPNTIDAAATWPSLDDLAVRVLFAIWFCGFAGSVAAWWRMWRTLRTTLRAAVPLDLDPRLTVPVVTTRTQMEPGVFGVFNPVLLLPEGILDRLTPPQLRSILAHELCHVRRRDNLTAAIHMLVESLFWFHPLVHGIGARLVEERERACDEEVLRQGAEPHVYAEGILSVCKFYLQSPWPCASGVTGANLTRRIEAIVSNTTIASRLTAKGKLLLMTAGAAAIAAPVLAGLFNAGTVQAQSSKERLAFEVASVKRWDPASQAGGRGPMALAPGVLPGGGIRSTVPVFNLICWAYRIDGSHVSGGPNWIHTDHYAIEARPADEGLEAGLSELERTNRARERVKTLLADRFKMTIRSETRESQVYVLRVAKGGHKLTPASPEAKSGFGVSRGAGLITSAVGAPMAFLAVVLTQELGRPVQDETGLGGHRFQFKLEFRPESSDVKRAMALSGEPVAGDDDPRPSIFSALKTQLGLELQSRKAAVPAIVVDRIERPAEN